MNEELDELKELGSEPNHKNTYQIGYECDKRKRTERYHE